ncbi:MAG: DeoR family transcriptional regulator [Candidatus Cohnella colombiensis]|uniref:DeoR family transcriptional regulator n=1 Tax=Candidatus Cohnella colombiensis TaxID=3121368 RepID=A0AA95ETJ5_9BACL|nr:MAG: DeoR family transcriptional regulator [Cohnella sp.]
MLPNEEGSTRRQLLQLIKVQGSCRIRELAQSLEVTEMAIRRHMHKLEEEGLITARAVRHGMGRPVLYYSLTVLADERFPRKYSQLTLDLLSELEEQPSGAQMIDSMFIGRRDKLEARYEERMQHRSLKDRVMELAIIQNAGGYMAEWESTDEFEVYQLYEYNCPISQIACRYRQACECEQQLFEKLLDADVERTQCLADGAACCTYKIRPKQKHLQHL